MLPLPKEFKVKGQRGFIYKLLKREGDVALVEQIDTEDNKVTAWEVFIVQKYPDRYSPDGKTFIPAKEASPRSELWGTMGYTYSTLEKAEERFAKMVESQAEKKAITFNEDSSVTFAGDITVEEKPKKKTAKKKANV